MNVSPTIGVGETLRTRRRQRDLTLEFLSRETHIHQRYLAALEEERWDEFPARVYLEGFLRQYAIALGLDGAALISRVREEAGRTEKPAFVRRSSDESAAEAKPAPFAFTPKAFVLGLLALVLAIFFVSKTKFSHLSPKGLSLQRHAASPVVRDPGEVPKEFQVRVKDTVWLRVWVDDHVSFEGALRAGMSKSWPAQSRFRVQASNPDLVEATANGKPLVLSGTEFLWTPAMAEEVPPAAAAPPPPPPAPKPRAPKPPVAAPVKPALQPSPVPSAVPAVPAPTLSPSAPVKPAAPRPALSPTKTDLQPPATGIPAP